MPSATKHFLVEKYFILDCVHVDCDIISDCLFLSLSPSLHDQWGVFIVCLEWITFVCTHNLGPRWKDATLSHAPSWVGKALEQSMLEFSCIPSLINILDFKTIFGTFMIVGLHGLPLYMYIYYHWEIIPFLGNLGWVLTLPIVVLVLARIYCLGVEVIHALGHCTCSSTMVTHIMCVSSTFSEKCN